MSLADLFAQDAPTKGPSCTMHTYLERLKAADRQVVETEMANPDRPATSIRRVLVAAFPDLDVPSTTTIRRHRSGECACPKA